MINNITENKFKEITGSVSSPKWGDYKVICRSKEQLNYAEKCVELLNSIDSDTEKRLCRYLYRYFLEFKEIYEEEMSENDEPAAITEDTILNYIGIEFLLADTEADHDIPEFHIDGSCVWEPEHGFEITISGSRILYVGPFGDYPPNSKRLQYIIDKYGYYDPNSTFNMNYADKE